MGASLSAALGACLATACGLFTPPDPPLLPTPDGVEVGDAEAVLFDVLECQEVARPSTLQRVRDLLHDPTTEEVQALLLNPTDLATVVGEGGAEVELAVVLLRNLHRITTDGTLGALVQHGWDGVSCGEPVTASCTAGTTTTTVGCDDQGSPQELLLGFSDCVVGGTLRQGGLLVTRDADDDTHARVEFQGLTIDEVDRLEGGLWLAVGTAGAGLEADADGDTGFAIVSHGGLHGDVSCGEETRVEAAHLRVTDDDALLELRAQQVGKEDRFAVRTFGDHLHFRNLDAFDGCHCPDVGSGLQIEVPRPLGHQGSSAHARVTWRASDDSGLCRDVEVSLTDWPDACGPLEVGKPDCAQDASARALAALFRTLCAR